MAFQLAPPHIHRRNASEREIWTFKAHLISILAGVADDYPRNLWDLLLPQAVLTLNLLRQATLNPNVLTWEFLEGPLDYNANPLAPLGCPVMIHKKTETINSWDFRSKEGWSIGTALDHYRCEQVIPRDTKAVTISDTVYFLHQYITAPTVTPADRILHSINTLTVSIK